MKRSPLTRKTPMNSTGILGLQSHARLAVAESKPPAGPRKRKCSNCGNPFLPSRMGQKVCGPACAQSFARRISEQQERKADKARKRAVKTRQQWLREAQAAFNAFIRARDADLPCISCGRFHGGKYDAGHYRSVGAMPALRFDELNVHKQCVPCNQHKGGNVIEYRIGLIARIGVAKVEALERDYEARKYTIEDAQNIKAHYKQKLKELQEKAK